MHPFEMLPFSKSVMARSSLGVSEISRDTEHVFVARVFARRVLVLLWVAFVERAF